MPAVTFFEGQVPTQAGFFFRLAERVAAPVTGVATGVVAAIIAADRGPLATVVDVTNLGTVETRFGTGAGPNVVNQALYGGAQSVKVLRVGSGGTKASRTMVDTTGSPVNVNTITAVDPGTDGNNIKLTIEDDPANPTTLRRILIYRGTVLAETHYFTKGATGTGEPQLMAAAVNAGSSIVTVANIADGNKILAAVSSVTLASGASVTVNAAAWTAALLALGSTQFNILVISAEDATSFASVSAQLNTWHDQGKFVEAVVGISAATTATEAARLVIIDALNNYHMRALINGFTFDEVNYEGAQAAGRYAGMIASTPTTASQTFAAVNGATAVVNPVADMDAAILGGAVAFQQNPAGTVQIAKDITTLDEPSGGLDSGWKYGRNTRQRLNFFARLLTLSSLLGAGNSYGNTSTGRAVVAAAIGGLIDDFIAEGAFIEGTVSEDADNPPVGTSAFYNINFTDVGSLDQALVTIGIDF